MFFKIFMTLNNLLFYHVVILSFRKQRVFYGISLRYMWSCGASLHPDCGCGCVQVSKVRIYFLCILLAHLTFSLPVWASPFMPKVLFRLHSVIIRHSQFFKIDITSHYSAKTSLRVILTNIPSLFVYLLLPSLSRRLKVSGIFCTSKWVTAGARQHTVWNIILRAVLIQYIW